MMNNWMNTVNECICPMIHGGARTSYLTLNPCGFRERTKTLGDAASRPPKHYWEVRLVTEESRRLDEWGIRSCTLRTTLRRAIELCRKESSGKVVRCIIESFDPTTTVP